MFSRLREDIACIYERDPAARSKLEILICYPGLHAVLVHRLAHRLWRSGFYLIARFISHLNRMFTGIELHRQTGVYRSWAGRSHRGNRHRWR